MPDPAAPETPRPILDVILDTAGNPPLPDGYDTWGFKITRPDLRTYQIGEVRFRWPWPGGTVTDEHTVVNSESCPAPGTGGFCIARTLAGAASGGYGHAVILLLAYRISDVAGEDEHKRRVSHCLVADVVAGEDVYRSARRADLQRADLRGADLRGAYLQGADLRGADLRGAYLQGADLQGADLRGAHLQGADLQGAHLQDAYLRGADLQDADLQRAHLQDADLQGADLRGAYLQGADLRRADLQHADLQDADLQRAHLQDAHLQHAYLQHAYLQHAEITDEQRKQFRGVPHA